MKPFGLEELGAIAKSNFGKSDGLIKRLVTTAQAALLELAELHDARRRVVEVPATPTDIPSGRSRLLIVLYRDGYVEAFGDAGQYVKIGHMPQVAPSAEQAAEDYMLSRLPISFRDLYCPGGPGRLAVGHCGGCLTRTSAKLLRYELEGLAVVRELEAAAASIEVPA